MPKVHFELTGSSLCLIWVFYMDIFIEKYKKTIQIDDEDYDLIKNYKWNIVFEHSQYYAITSSKIRMHRLIMGVHGKSGKIMIDHRDGNGLNNQKINLRRCNHKNNLFNQKIRKNNTSGFKGIHKLKTTGKYQAYISKGKRRYVQQFEDVLSAVKYYNKMAKILHGEFAKLNIVPN